MRTASFFLFIVVTSFFMSGCSAKQDCYIADSIKELKVNPLNEKGYFLFLRTTGFSEKEFFFELFNAKPQFDVCGQSISRPIYQVHVDDTEGFPVKLVISNGEIKIVYSTGSEREINLESINVIILNPPK